MDDIMMVLLGLPAVLFVSVVAPSMQKQSEHSSRALSAKYAKLLGRYRYSTGFK